jgi:uncharacterized repeat protein (TIGR01451 family)
VPLCLEALEHRTLLSNPATTGELISAIQNANNNSGTPTTITLAANTTFDFTSANNSSNGANALPVITGNITIVGNGNTIERTGTAAFRLFDVASGGSLTLENLTLTGGLAQGTGVAAEGGAVYNSGTLTLNRVTVQSNKAQGSKGADYAGGSGSAGSGGGLYVAAGSVTLTNDTLSGNDAQGGNGGRGGDGHTGSSSGDNGGSGGAGSGGGLYVAAGSVTLTNDTLSGNDAQGGNGGNGGDAGPYRGNGGSGGSGGAGLGGALYVDEPFVGAGTVTLANDTLSGNDAQGGNGGNGGAGLVNVGNHAPGFGGNGGSGGAGLGGGLDVDGGGVTLTNDTLSGNHAQGGNGGSGNSGGGGGNDAQGGNGGNATGGGLYVVSGSTTTLANTLIAQDTLTAGTGGTGGSAGSASGPDVSGTVTSSDHDLVGNSSGFTATTSTGDLLNLTASQLASLLDHNGLQNNGGPTKTIALPTGSLAIDAGNSNVAGLPRTDQRGYARIVGKAVDIGAYEYAATAETTDLSVSGNAPFTVVLGGQITYTLTVTNNSSSAQSNVTLANVLPANTTLVAWSVPSGWSSSAPAAGSSRGTVSAWTTSLAGNTSATFTLVVQLNSSVAPGTVISSSASVGPLGVPNNNSISFQTTVHTTLGTPPPPVANAPASNNAATPPTAPVGNLNLFALGLGPTGIDLFEVDSQGAVFVQGLFGGGLQWVDISLHLSLALMSNDGLMALLAGSNGQSYLVDVFDPLLPLVEPAVLAALPL